MDQCDVLIVGGGPGGAACAWSLGRAGLDTVIVDTAQFPRDKVCAGWITPPVIEDLQIDPDEYRRGCTFQPIVGFRVGFIGGTPVETRYTDPVSYAIRRCEFDRYLLERSGARLRLGTPVSSVRRAGDRWTVNAANTAIDAPMLVGAAGHFCPVARVLNGTPESTSVIAAQEAEWLLADDASGIDVEPGIVELYFQRDLSGYGWIFRKGGYLNVGFGHLGGRALPRATARLVAFLRERRKLPDTIGRWRGHAYLASMRRTVADAGVLLVGDAAGVASAKSGEGIRQAIESGLLAASVIQRADGRYTRDALHRYERAMHARFDSHPVANLMAGLVPERVSEALAGPLLQSGWFVRRVILDRWFLGVGQTKLAVAAGS